MGFNSGFKGLNFSIMKNAILAEIWGYVLSFS